MFPNKRVGTSDELHRGTVENLWFSGAETPTAASSMDLHTCPCVVACPVHASNEELQTDDGVDDDDKENQQGNVEQGNHGLHDGVQHDLQT